MSGQLQPSRDASDTETHFDPYSVIDLGNVALLQTQPSPSSVPMIGASPVTPPFLAQHVSGGSATTRNTSDTVNNVETAKETGTLGSSGATLSVAHVMESTPPASGRLRRSWEKTWKWCQRHWLAICLISVVLCLVISIPVGWVLRLKPFQDAVATTNDMVTLDATLIAISSDAQSMTVDWYIDIVDAACSQYPNTTISLYFDENLLRSSSSSNPSPPDNNRPSTPVFVLNTTETCSDDNFSNSQYFRTEIALLSVPGRTAQSYPFEKYNASIFMFASLPDNVTFPQVGIANTYGIAVGFNAELDSSSSYAGDGSLYTNLVITRGPAIRVYAIAIVIAIWLVTLTFLSTCIAVVFLHRPMSSTVLVLPVATLFAFTQLRSTLPGAPPGFGADIDFVGILPCLAIITFCAVLMTGVFLFGNPESYALEAQQAQDKEKQD